MEIQFLKDYIKSRYDNVNIALQATAEAVARQLYK